MMKGFKLGLFAAVTLSVAPAFAKGPPPVTGLALQQIQAKDLETTTDVLFPAVVSVLQDAGYHITAADKPTGFVTGVGSAEQKATYNIWFGFGKKKEVPMVSAFIEQRGPGLARVRLNFILSKAKSRNSFTDEKPITEPAIYKDAFEKIEKEVFVRQAMNAPGAGVPSQPASMPVATVQQAKAQ